MNGVRACRVHHLLQITHSTWMHMNLHVFEHMLLITFACQRVKVDKEKNVVNSSNKRGMMEMCMFVEMCLFLCRLLL